MYSLYETQHQSNRRLAHLNDMILEKEHVLSSNRERLLSAEQYIRDLEGRISQRDMDLNEKEITLQVSTT